MRPTTALSPRVPDLAERDILAIVVQLQSDVRNLTRRLEQSVREFAMARRTETGEVDGRRRIPLDEAARRGLLPAGRCARTLRNWMKTPESRARWKTDLFLSRVAGRVEVDLDGLERWRLAMATPTTPAWPRNWRRPS